MSWEISQVDDVDVQTAEAPPKQTNWAKEKSPSEETLNLNFYHIIITRQSLIADRN